MGKIHWKVGTKPQLAKDEQTGQRLYLSQIIFEGPVEIRLAKSFDHTFSDGQRTTIVEGTTGKILGKIHQELKHISEAVLEEDGLEIWFCRLYKDKKGKLVLSLSVE
jgi:hypothetical protein